MIDVILPVLDEASVIPWVLDRMPEGYSPVVVDNGSTDGSADVARARGARLIVEPVKGFGSACFAGLVNARADVVCFMDCDGSLDPKNLPLVAEPILSDRADLMLGARVPERKAWPLHARAANALLARAVRRRTGLLLRDIGPMRAARREPLLALGLTDRRFAWPLEMVIKASEKRWRVAETEIPYLKRTGTSKVTGTVNGAIKTVIDMTPFLR
jgi:glycosyltransferase involved in cell wall biosynthesis